MAVAPLPNVRQVVEYALTERGRSLGPVLKVIAEWGMENMFLNRVKFDDSIEL